MSGIAKLSAAQTGTLSSTMSDASCGLVLSRSVAWVVRMRRDLAAAGVVGPQADQPEADPIVEEGPAPVEIDLPAPAPSRAATGPARKAQGTDVLPSDAVIAAALSAACRLRGVDLADVNGKATASRRARLLGAAALRARFGTSSNALARRLDLHGSELAPTMMVKAGISTDDMLAVVEALSGSPEAVAGVSPVIPGVAPGPAPVPVLSPAAPPPFVPRERKAPKASPPRALVRLQPAPDRPSIPLPALRPPSERPRSVPSKPTGVVRLKPVTPDIARWARAFLASPIWAADEVADLFGVHPDALVDVLSDAVAA